MEKIWLFAILVVVVIAGVFFMSNQSSQKPQETESTQVPTQSPSPTNATSSAVPETSNTQPTTSVEKAVISTNKGDIELQLYPKDASKTVDNFIKKAQSGFYNNLTFHRVEDWVIQGGDPLGTGIGGEKMPTELNNKPFVVGSLGVARGQDIKVSNYSQFFITKSDASWLNNQYTNFGIVTLGMDVVDKIAVGDKILKITVQ